METPNPTATIGPLAPQHNAETMEEFLNEQRQAHQRELRQHQGRIARLTEQVTALQGELAECRRQANYSEERIAILNSEEV